MKATIQSHKEFLSNTTLSDSRFTQPFIHGVQGELGTEFAGAFANQFFVIVTPVKAPDTAKKPSDFINDLLSSGLILDSEISEGRKWVADAFFDEQPETLKALRLQAGYSQAQLAEKISMCQPNICEFESGKRKPSVDTLKRLADALGTTTDVILKSINQLEQ